MKDRINWFVIEVLVLTAILATAAVAVHPYLFKQVDQVLINEVCANNSAIIYDTIGGYYDYVEIYNPTETDKNIEGLYLSDDKDELKKYAFPEDTVIPAGGYLLLWGGEWSEMVLLEDDSLYLGFALRNGEKVYLSDEAGNIIDKVKVPDELEDNQAYSRTNVIRNLWKITDASPNSENYTYLTEKAVVAEIDLTFSEESGFYDEPFYLELIAEEECDIYYTLDGTEPTIDSTKYEEAIWVCDASANANKYAMIKDITLLEEVYLPEYNIEKATVVRAIAVDESGDVSEIKSGTYLVDYSNKSGFENISTLSIITDPDNLFDYERGIYVTGKIWDLNQTIAKEKLENWEMEAPTNYMCEGKEWQREVTLQFFNENGVLESEQQVGIRCHGRTSLMNNQKSFNLYALPERDGNEYLYEGLIGEAEKTLVLRNSGGRDCYTTKIRDVLNQQLVEGSSLFVADYKPCQVFIDGEYWGLYMLQERIAESTIAEEYGVAEDNIILNKSGEIVSDVSGDETAWTEVSEFILSHDMSLTKNYETVLSMIDLQSFIEHYCVEVYIANVDSITNNYAMWRVRETGDGEYEDGKWRWMLYDTDDSAGTFWVLTEANSDTFLEGNWGDNVLENELFLAMLENETFKQEFVRTFMDMANYYFDFDKVSVVLDELVEDCADATVVSQKRFFREDYELANYLYEIDRVRIFYRERYDYIVKYLKRDFLLEGELYEVSIDNGDIVGGSVTINSLELASGEKYQGKYYSDYTVNLSATCEDGYRFVAWDMNGTMIYEQNIAIELQEDCNVIPIWEKLES